MENTKEEKQAEMAMGIIAACIVLMATVILLLICPKKIKYCGTKAVPY